MKCPFYITAATAAFEATCLAEGDRIDVSVGVDNKWMPVLTAKFAVELPETAKLPQMQDMTLRCGKLSWVP